MKKREHNRSDTIYQVNGVAYIEADLKLVHLRIFMTILKQLQAPLRYKLSRQKHGPVPPQFLPPQGNGPFKILDIPVTDFNLGMKNSGRLRVYLKELQNTKIIFPYRKDLRYESAINDFSGIIMGFSFPAYAHHVKIYILDTMVSRLLLTEEGYSSYSESSAMSLSNKYTVRIYWLICSWRSKGGFVISVENLKRILSAGCGYDRKCNFEYRILRPAQKEFKESFPIWFEYRFYEKEGVQMLVFKIHVEMSKEERKATIDKARDFCFNLLLSIGAKPRTIDDVFVRLEAEDVKPFMDKMLWMFSYVREKGKKINDVNGYVKTIMDQWYDDWSRRYEEISDSDLPVE